jgi:hypothetical protein
LPACEIVSELEFSDLEICGKRNRLHKIVSARSLAGQTRAEDEEEDVMAMRDTQWNAQRCSRAKEILCGLWTFSHSARDEKTLFPHLWG